MILSATNAPSVTDATGTKANAATDPAAAQDRFLKLLVAQLNNQDPMNPLDNAQMTSQIAQINTVTGIQQLNQTMQSMAAQFNSLQVMQGTSLVGRSVMSEGSTLSVADKTGKGGFELASPATNVKVEVLNASGQVIDTMDLGAKAAGRHTFDWDGSQYSGSTDGLKFRVSAVNGSTKLDSTPLALSKVTAAGAEDGQLVLTLANGQTINYSQIKALV
ncbi:MAG: flagellar hook assembly protein FlgD [Acidovorax sp.]|uniref:flagellar hook assembly protein FlgD n=1 Tax=Acidovorax sp. TaxID=1872122 RepID=UPI0025BDF48C|nr:flagellar hook assembly protein FlgD [Acidovorax sp.]MCE1192018.1 flagellar hook assembly protein FlgD [Acidovorax sp.]